MHLKQKSLAVIPLLLAAVAAQSAPADTASQCESYSPYACEDFPLNVYWGDSHVHTVLSADAYGMNNLLTPEVAYRFAKGEVVTTNNGQPFRLGRPLDFIVVTDHAEYLGVSALLESDPAALAHSEVGQRWMELVKSGNKLQILMDGAYSNMGRGEIYAHDPAVYKSTWARVAEAADRHNAPGRFTAFIGFEWTSMPDGNNLHRNVIFRGDAASVKDTLPFSAIDSLNPEDLWRHLQQYEESSGSRVMAIPHNGNVSNGLMFRDRTYAGEPMSRGYAENRVRWEPLMEVTQMKGDSEAHPFLSPDDAFADFETWDSGNFNMPADPKQNDMLQYEYARPVLKHGLALKSSLGANPFKLGMIGSSDTHTALAAVEERNFIGKMALNEPARGRADNEMMHTYRYVAAGYAAVWARENTREAIFDAMQRREVYATTGPRMQVRFFGGWEFDAADALRPDLVATGYRNGVPMGGDLAPAPAAASPTFLVFAGKDPDGANLERIQIVKGWLDADGNVHEKVHDVALSDQREVKAGQMAPVVTSTVDVKHARYSNSVGAAQLSTVWKDPDFASAEAAFYYVRVLEILTPRWTTYDSAFYGTPLPKEVPAEIQDRAYTSPIWYSPPAKAGGG